MRSDLQVVGNLLDGEDYTLTGTCGLRRCTASVSCRIEGYAPLVARLPTAYNQNATPFVWRKREIKGAQLRNAIVNYAIKQRLIKSFDGTMADALRFKAFST